MHIPQDVPGIYLEVYGCSMNRGEAMRLAELAAERGWRLCRRPEDAQLAVVASCVVVQSTEKRVAHRIRQLSGMLPVVVYGCMASARPEVAVNAGAAHLVKPLDYSTFEGILGTAGSPQPYGMEAGIADVPICSGCMGSCTFCITKLARPALRSVPPEDITAAVRKAADRGAYEVHLSAQDAAVYGRDLGTSLPELIKAVGSLDGQFMVRVGMMNPDTLKPIFREVLDAYTSTRVYRFLHVPVQSGSDSVLERMGRRYTAGEFRELVDRYRGAFRDAVVATDVICGFPGEEEEDFEATLRLLEDVRPEVLNIKGYSSRPGTRAHRWRHPPSQVMKERTRVITEMHERRWEAVGDGMLGRVVDVLVTETGKRGTMKGRTRAYMQVVLDGGTPGTWVAAEVTGHGTGYLRAAII